MTGHEKLLQSGDARLFRRHWPPEGEARARMLIVHGFGEHCDRYGNGVEAVLPTELTRTERWVNAHAARLDLPLLVRVARFGPKADPRYRNQAC